ncbi:hypothetical protein OAC90_01340 [Planktomarina sp.]|nr:hypothetical protein [Planktomarina sp.]
MAGTGICSGEGGMLSEEQAENSRYFYELASAKFGWKPELGVVRQSLTRLKVPRSHKPMKRRFGTTP